jgi:hypothetical protein
MKKALVSLYISLSLLLLPTTVLPFETDQFNLPPVPLADVGDEVTEYVETQLRIVVDKLNAEIVRRERCVEVRTKSCESVEKEREKLAKLRSHEGFAEAFYEHIAGGNLMTTKFGKWMNSHEFRGQPARYKAPYKESIYILNPFNYATLSPTVRLYGHEFGIDKLEHLFQQGYQYYKIVNDAIKKGSTSEEATRKAIKWGQKTERTYYGLLTSGVYSNADLYANYVGLKFYQGLTKSVQIAETNRPASVRVSNGRWQVIEEHLKENILKPLIADQMNEALNPSSYRHTLVRSVRRSVKRYACPEWVDLLPHDRRTNLIQRTASLEMWNAEDYGFAKKDRTVKLDDMCFEPQNTN